MLPARTVVSDLPVVPDSVRDGLVEIHTDDELRVLHDLTGWALEHESALSGLSVVRLTLEDVYLSLTKDAGGDEVAP